MSTLFALSHVSIHRPFLLFILLLHSLSSLLCPFFFPTLLCPSSVFLPYIVHFFQPYFALPPLFSLCFPPSPSLLPPLSYLLFFYFVFPLSYFPPPSPPEEVSQGLQFPVSLPGRWVVCQPQARQVNTSGRPRPCCTWAPILSPPVHVSPASPPCMMEPGWKTWGLS